MDILKKYEDELSASEIQRPADNIPDSEDVGPIIRFVQKLFLDNINQKQANFILIGTAIFLLLFSVWMLSSKETFQPSEKMIHEALQRTVNRIQSQGGINQ